MKLKILSLIILGNLYLKAQTTNTILIIADDISPDYFGIYNESTDTANTPNIRELARHGVVFNKAWASPLCSPTRAGILTGRYPFRTGIGNVITSISSPQIDTAEMSVAELLKKHAPTTYNTACIGKWHLTVGLPNRYNYPNIMGFDYYSGNFNGALTNYYNYVRIKNGVLDTVTNYATSQTVDDAIEFLGTMNNSKPYFLWLAFNAPHSPYHLPPANLITTTGLSGTTFDINTNPIKYFKASVEAMDTEIGRLITYLKANNLWNNTNIIFIGDNGNDNKVSKNSIKTKSKGTLYDYGVRVPMVISGPAVANPNSVSNALVNTPDIFATILELCNFNNWKNYIPASKLPIDSKSIVPILNNSTNFIRNWTFTEQFSSPSDTSDGKTIRNTNYHLIRFDDGHQEFYNQSMDVFETNNLLQTNMTTQDIDNYIALCDSLSSLVGVGGCLTLNINNEFYYQAPKLFPNPIVNTINISSDITFDLFEIINIEGKIILKGNNSSIDVSSLKNGLYFLRLYNKYNLILTTKFNKL